MIAAAELFTQAVNEHRAGRIASAAISYRRLLAFDPGHARARHLLGFALLQARAAGLAEASLSRAVRQSPLSADAWTHLALARSELGRETTAAAFRRALVLIPGKAEAQYGLSRLSAGVPPTVTSQMARRQLVLDPLHAAAWHGLGLATAAADPAGPEGPRPIRHILRSVLLDPSDAPSQVDLASLQRSRRQATAARNSARRALCLAPGSTAARVNLAAALFDLDTLDGARAAARAAVMLDPAAGEAYGNLGQCAYRRACFTAAEDFGRRAQFVRPGDPQVEANLSSYRLALGDLDRGWPMFRNRPARRAIAQRPDLPAREWHGEPGARLLVVAEQGLGDELLFASCWPDLADMVRQGRLVSACIELDARLRPLAERTFPDLQWADRDRRRIATGERWRTPDVDASHWLAAGDLPVLLRKHLGDFPPNPAGLRTDPARTDEFRNWLDGLAPGERRLGLCWRSALRTEDRRKHYPDLADCRGLFRLPGVRLVVLQYDDCEAEIARALEPDDIHPLIHPDLDRRDDLDGVAALMAALDGVLSAETAVLALAGAIGVASIGFDIGPTWVLLGQSRSPWHPTVRRLHRLSGEPWADAMARLAAAQATL